MRTCVPLDLVLIKGQEQDESHKSWVLPATALPTTSGNSGDRVGCRRSYPMLHAKWSPVILAFLVVKYNKLMYLKQKGN